MSEVPAGPRESRVLSVRGIRTEFPTSSGYCAAVRDISFDVDRSERVGIVGESGSGKSALALSIMGLIDPPGRVAGGEVLVNGRDISGYDDLQMRAVRGRELALIYQDPMMALDPIRTIGDQLIEAIRLHQKVDRAQARRQALELLRDVEVPYADKRLDDYPHQYSGGMRQRVVIAMALANDPDLLIADEPTTALDVTTQAQVLDLLRRLAVERDAAVVMITHNLGVVAEFCTRVMVMYAGRIVEQSPVDELFERPTHPYTRALLESMPRPGAARGRRLPTIEGLPPALDQFPAGCAFEPRCAVGHGSDVCRTRPPQLVGVPGTGRGITSECHHVDVMLAQNGEVGRA